MGTVQAQFDFLAVQEVMTTEGLDRLQHALESASGAAWRRLESHALGRGSYQEHYAFLWWEAAVEAVEGATVYLDERTALPGRPLQPVSRQTVDGNLTFVVTTVHIVYGQSVAERTPDVRAYGGGLEVYPAEADVRILAGDFNLPSTHAAWPCCLDLNTALLEES